MKVVVIDLEKQGIVDQIRQGQMFQVQSATYGCFKSQAYRTDLGWLYFVRPDLTPVLVEFVDTLLYLNPIG